MEAVGTAPPILYLPIDIDPPPVYVTGRVHGWPYPPDETPEELSRRPPLMVKGRGTQTLAQMR